MRCLLFLFASCISLSAWSQTGSVVINCIDESSKNPLVACIQIETDTIAAQGCTELDGKRKFSRIKSGAIKIQITHNGDTLIPRAAFIQPNQVLQITVQISSGGSATISASNTYQKSVNGDAIPRPQIQSDHGYSGATLTREDITRLPVRSMAMADIMIVAYKPSYLDLTGMPNAYKISRDDIMNMPMRTATGIASTVVGTDLNEQTGEFNVRGARSDANVYYLDGFRVTNLDGVPKTMINRMTVYTGGIPAKYGDVTGGVIAIETKPIRVIPRTKVSLYSNRYDVPEEVVVPPTPAPEPEPVVPAKPVSPPAAAIPVVQQRVMRNVEPNEVSLNTFSLDRFTPIYENDFRSPLEDPNSTFSIDVDRASWTYVQNQYKHGLRISRDAVKLEEMVNAFDYKAVEVPSDELMHVEVERSKCAWNENSELVTIHLKAKDLPQETKRKAHNFVFLIDVSGSMKMNNKLELLQEGLIKFVKGLNTDDRVAIVTYAGSSGVLLAPTLCTDRSTIVQALDQLSAGGGTNGIGGIRSAYDLAEENYDPELNNRIILCTDGDFNVGISNPTELEDFIALRRGRGIYLTALGFGMGNYRNDVLESLADNGDGNHFYINNLEECKKVLVDEVGNLLNIARDVKLNVEFNPDYVAEYRLIGYENRLLKPRDFTDDTKDAGEIGYSHTVTAVYEITPGKAEKEKTSFTKTKTTIGNKNDLAIVKLRYKSFEDTSSVERKYTLDVDDKLEDSELLNTVVSFGLLLRDSSFKGEMTKEELAKMAAKLNGKSEEVLNLKEMIARFLVI